MKIGDVLNLDGISGTVSAVYSDGAVRSICLPGLNPAMSPGYRFRSFGLPVHSVTFDAVAQTTTLGFYHYDAQGNIVDDA